MENKWPIASLTTTVFLLVLFAVFAFFFNSRSLMQVTGAAAATSFDTSAFKVSLMVLIALLVFVFYLLYKGSKQ